MIGLRSRPRATTRLGFALGALLAASSPAVTAEPAAPLRIITFGAHPDDCELVAGGVAAKWAALGHKFKCVAVTNGDIGHSVIAGGPLAQRRRAESQKAARILGIETEVLDNHDGELMVTLENRRKIARLIRDWQRRRGDQPPSERLPSRPPLHGRARDGRRVHGPGAVLQPRSPAPHE